MTGRARPAPGSVDLWWIDRDAESHAGDAFADEDRRRAATIGAPDRCHRFLIARRALRRILSAYLDLPPEAIPIELAPDCKPLLPSSYGLAFNLSHCERWTALVVSVHDALGVDVVDHATFDAVGPDALMLVATPHERQALGTASMEAARQLWTRKEAFGKALGRGLLADLTSIEIGSATVDGSQTITASEQLFDILDVAAPRNVTAAVCASHPLRASDLKVRSGFRDESDAT